MHEWMIWSIEHGGWWGANRRGYVEDVRKAGLYTFEEADEIVREANRFRKKGDVPNEAMLRAFPLN